MYNDAACIEHRQTMWIVGLDVSITAAAALGCFRAVLGDWLFTWAPPNSPIPVHYPSDKNPTVRFVVL